MLLPLQLMEDARAPVGLLACGLLVSAVAVVRVRSHTQQKPHDTATRVPYLPTLVPLLGNTLELATNVGRFHEWVTGHSQQRDGKPFALRLLGKNDLVFIARPEHFEEVLKTQSRNFCKSDTTREVFDDFLGEDIVLLNGKRWQFHRKILASLITTRALREYMTPIIQENILRLQRTLKQWSETKGSVDFHKLVRHFTIDTFAEIGFGCKLDVLASGEEHPFEVAFNDANRISSERITSPTWIWKLKRWLNIGDERRLREAIEEMNELMMKLIFTAFGLLQAGADDNQQSAHQNLISIIVSSEREITPTEVRDIALSGLEAGRNTTADTLSWLFHALSHNPRVETTLRAEIAAKLPKLEESDSYVPSFEEIQEVPYLEATIREVLRLYPTVPTVPYHCVNDTVLADNTFIPAGTDVFLTLYAAGRLASVWGHNATEFSPERFIDEKTGKLCQDSPYSAFSDGPRVCLGRNLAMLQLKIVAATIISRFHLSEDPEQDVQPILDLTIGMKDPLMMRVETTQQEEAASFS
ncbi:hypothetical protein PRIC1_006191 [Phytophthora ramorum]